MPVSARIDLHATRRHRNGTKVHLVSRRTWRGIPRVRRRQPALSVAHDRQRGQLPVQAAAVRAQCERRRPTVSCRVRQEGRFRLNHADSVRRCQVGSGNRLGLQAGGHRFDPGTLHHVVISARRLLAAAQTREGGLEKTEFPPTGTDSPAAGRCDQARWTMGGRRVDYVARRYSRSWRSPWHIAQL
jgi:hypothetical protein